MKYNVGDIVQIKSLEWYKNNVITPRRMSETFKFVPDMKNYCGLKFKIIRKNEKLQCYELENTDFYFMDYMFDDIKEIRKTKLKKLYKTL